MAGFEIYFKKKSLLVGTAVGSEQKISVAVFYHKNRHWRFLTPSLYICENPPHCNLSSEVCVTNFRRRKKKERRIESRKK